MSRRATFLELPGTYSPEIILLGSILVRNDETESPHPSHVLSPHTREHVRDDEIKTQSLIHWHSHDVLGRANFSAREFDILPVSDSVSGGSWKHRSLSHGVFCEELVIEQFVPSESSLAKTLNSDIIRRVLPVSSRPSIYLVSGRIVAYGARYGAEAGRGSEVNARSGLEEAGAGMHVFGDDSTEMEEQEALVDQPFVLAYELKRVRRKRRSGHLGKPTFGDYFNGDRGHDRNVQDVEAELEDLEMDDVLEALEPDESNDGRNMKKMIQDINDKRRVQQKVAAASGWQGLDHGAKRVPDYCTKISQCIKGDSSESSRSTSETLRVSISWELPDFVVQCLGGNKDLANVFTVTGSADVACGTTCR